MTYRPPTRQRDSNPAQSQEARLLDLLRKAEGYAYALAHGYDIAGQLDRAYAFVAFGERLHNTAADVSDLARPVEPHSVAPVLGLRSRAFSLRRLLRGTAWQGPSVAPLVPQLARPNPKARSTTAFSDSGKALDSFSTIGPIAPERHQNAPADSAESLRRFERRAVVR